jgi:hypothetical protein
MLPIRKGEPIPPLTTEDYDSCVLIERELEQTLRAIETPALRRELADLRARMRAAMEGYEAVGPRFGDADWADVGRRDAVDHSAKAAALAPETTKAPH